MYNLPLGIRAMFCGSKGTQSSLSVSRFDDFLSSTYFLICTCQTETAPYLSIFAQTFFRLNLEFGVKIFFQDWELLILQELKWELSSVSPLDFLDHIIARIGLNPDLDLTELKRRTETILVLAITEYQFSNLHPSLLAATALTISLKFVSEKMNVTILTDDGKSFEEIKDRIMTVSKVDLVSDY